MKNDSNNQREVPTQTNVHRTDYTSQKSSNNATNSKK